MVTSRFFPDYGGGAKQSLFLCQKLQERGINPFVITFNHRRNEDSGLVAREAVAGIRVTRLSPIVKGKTWTRYGTLLAVLIQQRKYYDMVHIHGIDYQAYTATLVAQLFKKKVIAKIASHGADDPLTILNSRGRMLKGRMLSLMDAIICPTDHLVYTSLSAGLRRRRLVNIPNGVDDATFKPLSPGQRKDLRRKLGIGMGELIIIFAGALRQVKGVDVLLDAFNKLVVGNQRLKLILVGPCDKEQHWGVDEEYVDGLRALAGPQVIFTGYVHPVYEYLQAADVFVLPSWREGLSNSLLEAMACGLPSIATRLPSNEEVMRNGENGLLFEAGKADDLAEKLSMLLEDKSLRHVMGHEARKTILEGFSMDRVADRYAGVYKALL